MIKLAERIKELRTECKLTQSDLAKLFNYGQTTIAKWESGSRQPSFDDLIKLSQILKASTDYLLGLVD